MYERYAARIHRFCVQRLGDQDEAADAVQDTFLRAWLALRNGTEIRHPLSWLLTIADNVCVSRFRAREARVATTELSDGTGVDFPEAVGEVAGLAAALRALPDRQRQALLRRELQGYSYDEIGAELGASRASVAALLHRARLAVADTLRDARRGVAAVVPIPAFLRATFESGTVASVAVAGTAVVAVAQLAGPSFSSPSPPARSAVEVPAAVDAGHAVAATVRARPVAGRVSVAATEVGRRQPRDTGVALPSSEGVRVLGMVVLPRNGPTSPHLPQARPQPSPSEEPAAGPTTPEEPQPGATPAAGPQAPASEAEEEQTEQAEEAAPTPGRRGPGAGATPPGKQPKGSKGRSASAPGHSGKPEKAPPPAALGESGGGSSDAGEAPTAPSPQAGGEGAPSDADTGGGGQAPDERPGHAGGGQQGGGQGQGGGDGKDGDEPNGSAKNGGGKEKDGGKPGGRAP